jgi:hypothetical protein
MFILLFGYQHFFPVHDVQPMGGLSVEAVALQVVAGEHG